jgi:hypothetical protein
MAAARQQNPYAPLVVPASLLCGFAYVHWMGYSSEDPEPLHQALAFFFEPGFATIGAALFVSVWAVYAVRLNLARRALAPQDPFPHLARRLSGRLQLPPLEPSMAHLPQLAGQLARVRFEQAELPELAGELGSFLGEALRLERNGQWQRHDDPELGPYAYQGSHVLMPQPAQPPLKLNVYSVALRALEDPQELLRFQRELDSVQAAAQP